MGMSHAVARDSHSLQARPPRHISELGKVTAFVVTDDKPRHLLAFKHPTAGLQLPTGTVEAGEAPITAAKREVWEETGLEVASGGVVLSEEVNDLGPTRAAMLETVLRAFDWQ